MGVERHGRAAIGGQSGPVGRAAAALATLALLLQMAFAFPLAVRMAMADPLAGDMAICSADPDAGATHPPMSGEGRPGHEHCLLCHGHGLPLAPVVALLTLPLLRSFLAGPRRPAAVPVWPARRFEPYASRAPPLTA